MIHQTGTKSLTDMDSQTDTEEVGLLPINTTATDSKTEQTAIPPPCRPRSSLFLPEDTLHTRIWIPNGLPRSHTTNPHMASASASSSSLPPTTPFMVIEEGLASNFVHACCRVHEASNVVTALGNHLVGLWSGLEPAQASAATTIAVATDSLSAEVSDGETVERLPIEAAAVQTLLSCTQLQVAMAGAVAGMVLAARTRAVANGQLSPLSALPESAKQPAAGTTTHTEAIVRAPGMPAKSAVAITMAEFTGDRTATAKTIARFQHSQKELSTALCYMGKKLAVLGRKYPFGHTLRTYLESTASRLDALLAEASALETPALATPHNMKKLLESASVELGNAAYSMRYLAADINRVDSWRGRRNGKLKFTLRLLSCCVQEKDKSHFSMIFDCYPLCDQTISAVEAIQKRLSYAGL